MSLTRISSIKKGAATTSISSGKLKSILCSISGIYFLNQTSFSFTDGVGSQNVTITSLFPFCEWSVANLPGWITVSANNGVGGTTISINVTSTASARNATILIAGVSVYVSQSAPAPPPCRWPPSWGWC